MVKRKPKPRELPTSVRAGIAASIAASVGILLVAGFSYDTNRALKDHLTVYADDMRARPPGIALSGDEYDHIMDMDYRLVKIEQQVASLSTFRDDQQEINSDMSKHLNGVTAKLSKLKKRKQYARPHSVRRAVR